MEMWWCLVVLIIAAVSSGGHGAPIGNNEQRGLESTTAAAFNNYSREHNASSGDNTTGHAVSTDTPVPQPLFLDAGKQTDWRGKKDGQQKGKPSAKQPLPWTETDKLQNNSTDFHRGDFVPACFNCVLCQITNSCKK